MVAHTTLLEISCCGSFIVYYTLLLFGIVTLCNKYMTTSELIFSELTGGVVCLFEMILYILINIFQSCRDGFKQRIKAEDKVSFSMKQAVPPICGVGELPMIERFLMLKFPQK